MGRCFQKWLVMLAVMKHFHAFCVSITQPGLTKNSMDRQTPTRTWLIMFASSDLRSNDAVEPSLMRMSIGIQEGPSRWD